MLKVIRYKFNPNDRFSYEDYSKTRDALLTQIFPDLTGFHLNGVTIEALRTDGNHPTLTGIAIRYERDIRRRVMITRDTDGEWINDKLVKSRYEECLAFGLEAEKRKAAAVEVDKQSKTRFNALLQELGLSEEESWGKLARQRFAPDSGEVVLLSGRINWQQFRDLQLIMGQEITVKINDLSVPYEMAVAAYKIMYPEKGE